MRNPCFLKTSIGLVFLFMSITLFSQQSSELWLKTDGYNSQKNKHSFLPNNGITYQLNIKKLQRNLAAISTNETKGIAHKSTAIDIPNIKGEMETFSVTEASVFEPELQQRFPSIRSYIGSNENSTIRFSVSNQKGLSLTYISGENLGFIEKDIDDKYKVYKRVEKDKKADVFECLTNDTVSDIKATLSKNSNQKDADDVILRTYKLALSVTAEYTEYHFGSSVGSGQEAAAKAAALAAMNATLTRVNGVFERDFAVRLSLIATVDDLIYTDPTNDPYSNYENKDNWTSELQNNLTTTVGNAGYDIGHLFGHAGGGGDAGCIGCVCTDGLKGSAYTSPIDAIPEGDTFDLDYVAHELGHQFGANHTWTTSENGPSNESTGANLEPGSGSTIMGYAGITTANVQSHGDDYFHFKSIEQVSTFVKSTTCAVETALTQNSPTSDAGNDYTIPYSTAFILSGTGTSDGTTTYCWEQNDIGGNGGIETSNPSGTNVSGPMFRSFIPTTSAERYMPKMESVLEGDLFSTWESVASVSRNMHFKLTVRDNMVGGSQNAIDDMMVSVDDSAGPFIITSQNTEDIIWARGTLETITWDVAGTNQAPINTSDVTILLSVDDGLTYNPLIESTPNDGNQEIRVPATAAPFCRVMVRAVDNIYYAVNSTTFAIDYEVETTETCTVYSSAASLSIPDGLGEDFPGTTVSDIINSSEIGEITDINLTVDIDHEYASDLHIQLTHPDGTKVTLFNRDCSDELGIQVQFDDDGSIIECPATPNTIDGTFRPSDELKVLNTKDANGNWALSLTDYYEVDTGTLNSWEIEICSKVVVLIPIDELPINDISVYPNPAEEMITISLLSESLDDMYISLFDMSGRLIIHKKESFNSKNINIPFYFENISKGIYVLNITQGENLYSSKLIVK